MALLFWKKMFLNLNQITFLYNVTWLLNRHQQFNIKKFQICGWNHISLLQGISAVSLCCDTLGKKMWIVDRRSNDKKTWYAFRPVRLSFLFVWRWGYFKKNRNHLQQCHEMSCGFQKRKRRLLRYYICTCNSNSNKCIKSLMMQTQLNIMTK